MQIKERKNAKVLYLNALLFHNFCLLICFTTGLDALQHTFEVQEDRLAPPSNKRPNSRVSDVSQSGMAIFTFRPLVFRSEDGLLQ